MKPKPQAILCVLPRILAKYGAKDASETCAKRFWTGSKIYPELTDGKPALKEYGDMPCKVTFEETHGPHKKTLDEVLESISDELKKSDESVETVQELLEDVADGYQDIVDNDPFKRSGN